MKRYIIILVIIAGLSFPSALFPDSDTQNSEGLDFSFSPLVYYQPETSLAFGFAGGFFIPHKGYFPSVILPSFIYTLKNQMIASVLGDFYLDKKGNHLKISANYKNYPAAFYGLGNQTSAGIRENYVKRELSFSARYLFPVFNQVKVGAQFFYSLWGIKEYQEKYLFKGILDSQNDAGNHLGLGVVLELDSRDLRFSPSKGSLIEVSLDRFADLKDNSQDFFKFRLNSRTYFPIFKHQVLAVQNYLVIESGNPPLFQLPGLGGEHLLRGYYANRYVDKNLLVIQAEYRFPLFDRVRGVAFVGMGNVVPEPGEFFSTPMKVSSGFGLRYLILPNQNLVIRVDVGYTEDSWGLYFGFQEAF